jgi:hypothetical protein
MNGTPSTACAGAGEPEAANDRRADAARAAGHQHALVRELVRGEREGSVMLMPVLCCG